MNSRTLRRLAADHAALRAQPLPPNYFFPATSTEDDLTQLDVLLAGPSHTPFARGVFRLHLTIPINYPNEPPKAAFWTKIFHPNVDPESGGVCVETLKRDWDNKLTLRDVLVVISCLLIQPNPDSALNAEAGALIQQDYAAFERRAKLMTGIHAGVPVELEDAVKEAVGQGQANEEEVVAVESEVEVKDFAAPVRRRRPIARARQRGAVAGIRSEGSPSGGCGRRRQHPQPFVLQSGHDDVFGDAARAKSQKEEGSWSADDDSMTDTDQENHVTRSPTKARTPRPATPRRPQGSSTPFGELTMEEENSPDTDSDDEMSTEEYPPSPRKSPLKSPRKLTRRRTDIFDVAESSRDAGRRAERPQPNTTPPQTFEQPLATHSPFTTSFDPTPSPRKVRLPRPLSPVPSGLQRNPGRVAASSTPRARAGAVVKPRSPSPHVDGGSREKARRREVDEKLWLLCGEDVRRWNRGDFEGEPFGLKAGRW
ncbi:hypothetical protein LTR62_002033 [Meristemomyces frigidus]|uniref:Ubiquitin-conjugating enzyme E2 2 n=1 Tax=Meristemomyces frigidus TaxID=1508187 RepID=A0AAN7TMN7_9PEZI|nr:hypothetical protein LTR62_002033 [Meristemomyces frigidus]